MICLGEFELNVTVLPWNFSIFGDTFLWSVHDFDMELMFVMDKIQGNCSIYSMSIDNGKHDNDDVWIHGNHILQHDPNWFWHIPSPEVYWYKVQLAILTNDEHHCKGKLKTS